MQTTTDSNAPFFPSEFITSYLRNGDLFLDIETTGLSRHKNTIYLIGYAYITDGRLTLQQLFAAHPSEERELLSTFFHFLKNSGTKRILTFNGASFDLPFLLARADHYGLSLSLDDYKQLDIYKECRKRKSMLSLPGCRQKDIEAFLGIQRDDLYDGGALIRIYEHYTKQPSQEAFSLLHLHNYEDVLHLYRLLDIFSFDRLFLSDANILQSEITEFTNVKGHSCEELLVTLLSPCHLPCELSVRHPVSDVYLHAKETTVRMRIPLYEHMARLYFDDYKNYVYLPAEDRSIHKSLALCVDPADKKKATPKTCYLKVAVDSAFLNSAQLGEYVTHVLLSFLPGFLKEK